MSKVEFPNEPTQVTPTIYTGNQSEDYDPDERSCWTCGGDGFEWCEDTNTAEGCWERDCDGEAHTCPNCRGSGDAEDVWYW